MVARAAVVAREVAVGAVMERSSEEAGEAEGEEARTVVTRVAKRDRNRSVTGKGVESPMSLTVKIAALPPPPTLRPRHQPLRQPTPLEAVAARPQMV